jgi:hypothetical protein
MPQPSAIIKITYFAVGELAYVFFGSKDEINRNTNKMLMGGFMYLPLVISVSVIYVAGKLTALFRKGLTNQFSCSS